MVLLATFSSLQLAQRFSDYANSLNISHQLLEKGNQWEVWLEDDEQLGRAREELQVFEQNPFHQRFRAASWVTGDKAASAKQMSQQYGKMGFLSRHKISMTGPVTLTVLILCAGIYLVGYEAGVSQLYQLLMFPQGLTVEQPWRLISPVFLHFGWVHLAFNLLWWWELGMVIERINGSLQLLLLATLIGLVSNWMQFLWTGPAFGGLSGVVYGLLGYLWVYPKVNPTLGLKLSTPIVIFMLIWLALGFTGLAGPVANEAHLSGLLCGVVAGFAFGWLHRSHPPRGQDGRL